MEMFDLRWKTCFLSEENLVVFHLVFHWVSKFIHLNQMEVIYWLLTEWIINEFEKEVWKAVGLLKNWIDTEDVIRNTVRSWNTQAQRKKKVG